MDGGSMDNSLETIEKYGKLLAENCGIIEKEDLKWYVKKDTGFPWNQCLGISYRWISEKDNGQVHALKKGFRMAKGHIYDWLNSDDIYANPEVLQRVCTYFDQDPALELLFADGTIISKTGEKLKLYHVDRINLKELLYLDYHILQPSTFFRKHIYKETLLDDQLICTFDANFFIGLLYNGVNYQKVNDIFSAIRLYEETKTLKFTKKRHKELLHIAGRYSKNHYFLIISTIYRTIQGIYETRFKKKKPFVWLWIITRRICYKLVTGKWKRY
jgi:glycosyltransferase involved in cell wall biosynthesis